MVDLLPCPFCGGPASIEHKEHGVVELGCDNVGCGVLPSATQLSVKAAAESWNRRTPSPQPNVAGAAAIRKVGDAAVQKLVDRFALTHFMPDSDELTDYLRSIVDACVKAATERPE